MTRAVLIAAVLAAGCSSRREPSLVLPEFSMKAIGSKSETTFSRKDLLGRVWIVDFIFTRCAGPCPLLSRRMSGLAKQLPADIGLITISVDPEGDTPERLRAYALRYDAQPGRWMFLRGSIEDTYRLLYAGFRLPLSTNPGAAEENRVTHSTRLVLLGKDASIQGYYDGLSDLDAAALGRDARRLLEVVP
ncbi:MAG: SCO family protein [Elusimicrobiota bacterium]